MQVESLFKRFFLWNGTLFVGEKRDLNILQDEKHNKYKQFYGYTLNHFY